MEELEEKLKALKENADSIYANMNAKAASLWEGGSGQQMLETARVLAQLTTAVLQLLVALKTLQDKKAPGV